jgi:hypothetical protein
MGSGFVSGSNLKSKNLRDKGFADFFRFGLKIRLNQMYSAIGFQTLII